MIVTEGDGEEGTSAKGPPPPSNRFHTHTSQLNNQRPAKERRMRKDSGPRFVNVTKNPSRRTPHALRRAEVRPPLLDAPAPDAN